MLRRPVDLTLSVPLSTPPQLTHTTFPPLFPDFEMLGSGRTKRDIQYLCRIIPYQLDNEVGEVMMDVILGHSTPNTHVDLFLHDWDTMHHGLPVHQRWARRDSSQLPTTSLVGPAAVVDVSDIGAEDSGDIDLDIFKERARHVEQGDILIIRTDQSRRFHPYSWPELMREGVITKDLPQITEAVAEWLIKEKQISVCITDMVVDDRGGWQRLNWRVEQLFYRAGVVQIDDAVNLHNLTEQRCYISSGIVYKIQGTENSPARVVALTGSTELAEATCVDLFCPVRLPETPPSPPYRKIHPQELKADLMKKCWIKGILHTMHMKQYGLGEDMLAWLQFNHYSNHIGTHMKFPLMGESGQLLPEAVRCDSLSIPSEKLIGRAVVVDTPVGCRQDVDVKDLEQGLRADKTEIRPQDIVIVRTGFADDFYHRPDFLTLTPGFSRKAVNWLLDKGIKILVTDAASIEAEAHKGHTFGAGHMECFGKGVPVVLCTGNLWMLRKPTSFVFCSPAPIAGLNAAPVRVMAVEEYR